MTTSSVCARGALLLGVGLLLASCGGGGGGSTPTNSGGSGTGANPPVNGGSAPPPPSGPNLPPVLVQPNPSPAHVAQLHPYRYDVTQGGRTFSDPDGDPLHYEITIGHTYNPDSDPNPPPGLRVEGTHIVGAPEELGFAIVTVTAIDDSGAYSGDSDQFTISVDPNGVPQVISATDDQLFEVGASVDIDATVGSRFSDPDGDSLSYEVSLRGEPRGLEVAGTRVSGVFASVGVVEVTVSARDAYGGVGDDVFLIAAPAPEPGLPTLPDPPFVYRDDGLVLPFIFQDPINDSEPEDNRTTDAGATLGRVLFYDKRLSITNTVSCSSCHQPSHGFASPDAFSTGALGVPTKRHAMALANVRFSAPHRWFADMRAESLESLVLQPLANPEELGSSPTQVESKLRATSFYEPLFEAAFGSPAVTNDRVARALAQYLRALISYRTKLDLAFNPMFNGPGDPASVLTAQEMRGFEIFDRDGIGACGLCHDLRTGVNIWWANNGLDVVPTDPGTLDVGLSDGSVGVFRAPALRNIAVSGPYMHDGRFATLREVIDHYDHGVQDSFDLDSLLREQLYGPPRRLNLSEDDKQALEAFLRTMTDEEMLADPKFSDPFD